MLLAISLGAALASASAGPVDATSEHEKVQSAYRAEIAKAGPSAGDQVSLALWCESHGLSNEKWLHLAKAIVTEPSHPVARALLGQVKYQDAWLKPEAVAERVNADENLSRVLKEYEAKRSKTEATADAQWKLALWCEERGLSSEASAHFTAVARLEPTREAAWKRLGYKKINGRWLTDPQAAAEKVEAELQKAADRLWKPRLEKLRAKLKDRRTRDEAELSLGEVSDPRAIPMILTVFGDSSLEAQTRAVRLLGQIEVPKSSQALVPYAVFSKHDEIRRVAAETLAQRDPRESGGLLVSLLRDPIKYEVKPVEGPGKPGELLIKNPKGDLRRLYVSPENPGIPVGPVDFLRYDEFGRLVVSKPLVSPLDGAAKVSDPNPAFREFLKKNEDNPGLGAMRSADAYANSLAAPPGARLTGILIPYADIPVKEFADEFRKAAVASQAQLERDVNAIDRYNAPIIATNERVTATLSKMGGVAEAKLDRLEWVKWWYELNGFTPAIPTIPRSGTVSEIVPSGYNPQPPTRLNHLTSLSFQTIHPRSCFGAGTSVITREGRMPIESISPGVLVLSQNIDTGELSYRPVLVVHKNPPAQTLRLKIDSETVIATPFHRFWKTGHGWIQARHLKVGDKIRMLGDSVSVTSIESDLVQPVFNLDVADDHSFFVGTSGLLAHDNTLPKPALEAFDFPKRLASAK